MKNMLPLLIIIIIAFCMSGCYNDKYDKLYPAKATCDTSGVIKYSVDIVPIISTNCYSPGNGCHDAAGAATSGFDYTTYDGLKTNIADGSLLTDINWAPTKGHNKMPKNGNQLAQCDINKITRWINEGYLNN